MLSKQKQLCSVTQQTDTAGVNVCFTKRRETGCVCGFYYQGVQWFLYLVSTLRAESGDCLTLFPWMVQLGQGSAASHCRHFQRPHYIWIDKVLNEWAFSHQPPTFSAHTHIFTLSILCLLLLSWKFKRSCWFTASALQLHIKLVWNHSHAVSLPEWLANIFLRVVGLTSWADSCSLLFSGIQFNIEKCVRFDF